MKIVLGLLAVTAITSPAGATTLTFDQSGPSVEDDVGLVYESQGFRFATSSAYGEYNEITLHDDGGGITSTTIERVGGGAFTPQRIDLSGWSVMFRTGHGPVPEPGPDYPNSDDPFTACARAGKANHPGMIFTGLFADGTSVSRTVQPVLDGTLRSAAFGRKFAGIAALSLSILYPDTPRGVGLSGYFRAYDLTDLTEPHEDWCLEYCAQINADNLVIADTAPAPVPLPGSGLFLFGAALALAALRGRSHLALAGAAAAA